MNKFPWEYNSDFTEEILTEIANFIANVRNEVIERHDDELGDTRLALGMRAYECCRSRIIREAGGDRFPYLSIITPDKRFTFLINNTPVRFTRNDPKYLPEKKLIVSNEAMEQMSLFGDGPYGDLRWFFVFDTEYKSAADAVYFVGYDEIGKIICQWQIPVEDNVTLVTSVTDTLPQAVDVDKPRVAIKRSDSKGKKTSHENS